MKTITLDEEAYTLLRGLKVGPGDSFSDVVKRQLGPRGRVDDSAGAWGAMTDAEIEALRRESVETFGYSGKKNR